VTCSPVIRKITGQSKYGLGYRLAALAVTKILRVDGGSALGVGCSLLAPRSLVTQVLCCIDKYYMHMRRALLLGTNLGAAIH